MGKKTYLNELFVLLKSKQVSSDEIKQVLEDYEALYDEGLADGLSDEEIEKRLGTPKDIYQSLKGDLTFVESIGGKITGLMVFIVIPIYFVLGMTLNLWHPGWLIFTAIPITGILTGTKGKDMFAALSVFIALNAYLLIAHFIPEFYVYGWTVFWLVPFAGVLSEPMNTKRLIGAALIVLSVGSYLYLGFAFSNWSYPLFIFLIPVIHFIIIGDIQIYFSFNQVKKHSPILYFSFLLVLSVYLLVSILTQGWAWTWMILLLIPMIAIFYHERFRHIVAYTPFIATAIFFSTGYFIEDGWRWSWIAFLLIPVSGILFEGTKSVISVEYKENDEESEDEDVDDFIDKLEKKIEKNRKKKDD